MSKSWGNVVSVADALSEAEALRPGQGGAIVRWALMQAQWTKPLDWQSGLLERAAMDLAKFASALQRTLALAGKTSWPDLPPAPRAWSGAHVFWESLADNFNVPRAVASLHQAAQAVSRGDPQAEAAGRFLGEALAVLGLTSELWPEAWRWAPSVVPDEVKGWVQQREAARAARDFATADAWRQRLLESGWQVLDRPGGPEVVAAGNG